MTQDMTKDMILHTMTKKLVRNWRTRVLSAAHSSSLTSALTQGRNLCAEILRLTPHEITARSSRDYGLFLTRLQLVVLMLLMMTLGVENIWAQNPVVITTDANNSGTIEDSEKKLYLIQTNGFQSFYMTPKENTVMTNNILGDDMLWFFMDGGKVGEVQYYYIINNSTGEYIYNYNGNSRGIQLISSTDFTSLSDANKEKCKFKLVIDNSDNTTDFYNIDVKASQSYYGLNKQNGSAHPDYPIRLTNDTYIHDSNSKWKFIPYNGTFTWPTPPFTPSDDSGKHFYKIRNAKDNAYYVSTDETPEKVTFASTESDRMVWYLKEAGSDTWFKYYYIINPSTGDQYMYYNGTLTNGNDQTDAVSVKAYDSTDEDRYQFVVVQAARGDGAKRVECYAIIPKKLLVNLWSSNSIGPKAISNGANMGIIKSRGDVYGQWTFETTDFSTECADPTITFSTATGKATIETTTAFSTIHYTTDGTTPSSTEGTEYTGPFDVTEETTINAIVTKNGFTDSHVVTTTIYQVATPTIQNDDYSISIATDTDGATIRYTTDGSEPNTSSTEYISPLSVGVSGATIKAIAVKDGMVNSAVASKSGAETTLRCATPTFTKSGTSLTINCDFPSSGVSIYYIKNGGESEPTTTYSGSITVADGDVVKAVAKADGYNDSYVGVKIMRAPLSPTDGKYLITNDTEFESFVDMANSAENDGYHYVLQADVNASVTVDRPFTGTFEAAVDAEGNYYKISGLNHALFNTISGGTVKNVVLDGVNISTGTNVGAIANVVEGTSTNVACIYNCGILSGSVGGSGYVGGIVGLLGNTTDDSKCYARVINCYSYANITSGSDKGGIVGYNSYASKSGDIRTMVMNCMFYGTISGGDNISPVYGGLPIHNLNGDTETGLNTYNYYRYESNKKNITAGKYNNALAAKDQYLTRFELYRQLLNGNRKLAAWYATGNANKGVGENNEMAKWVLDKSIAPYPILKKQDYYPSVVNYDPVKYYDDSGTEVQRSSVTERNKGKILGELTVNISNGGHGSIKEGKSQITLKRIDKDYGNYNYNYDKVQLPYFNEVGDGNYTTDGWVVTGWKVTVSGGSNSYTPDEYDVTYDSNGKASKTPFNFADRNCTAKDNYANSKRVFSQGAYFDVPYGVSEISIEAYWGKAAYICDQYYDVVYKVDFTSGTNNIDDMGNDQGNTLLPSGQTIYHTITGTGNALASLTGVTNPTVYDYALVLVGNLHLNDVPSAGDKPFTIMSADFDHDNEPDYSLIYTHFGEPSGRKAVSPIRFDFINVPGMAMAQKPEGATYFRNIGIFNPKGWFEITNTCNIAFTQFEYDNGGKSAAPLILLGGEFEQFVSTQNKTPTVTQYIHVGGNAWFKEFNNGTHSDGSGSTKHIPISATGGDYDNFYLSGAYRPDAAVTADDAEGYISGGRFGEVAGAGQQQINGKVYWQIYDADITDFYGGGINSEKPITGNITVDMFNSHVTTYCGGPKFGNNDQKVTTNATGCTFTNYYGAGYGGIAYVRKRTQDATAYNFTTWVGQYTTNKGKYFDGSTKIGDNSKGEMAGPGVAVDFDYEFFVWSSGATGGRFYIKYASLSFATTNDVESILNNCDITESFYGGGRLGKVDGTINSTLNGCRVTGNVFGAGYSADRPKVPYRDGGFAANGTPEIDVNAGVFADGVKSTNIEELELNPGQSLSNNTTAIGTSGKIDTDFTEDQLKALGTVSGEVTLNINDYTVNSNTIPTAITGNVYGGGAMSAATSNVFVNISGNSTVNNVYGGGDLGAVGGNTTVTLKDNVEVNGNVFGGGNEAPVSGSATVNILE